MDGAPGFRGQNAGMKTASRVLPWLAYAAFWLGVGLFFALAEWQRYELRGGAHPWEPFLWEISGSLTTGLLAVAVYRLNERLLARQRGAGVRAAAILAGAPLFALAHSALMYGARYPVYALAGIDYDPGDLRFVLGYESAKDVVSYALVLGLGMGWRAFLRGQRQAAEVERLNAHLAEARLARLQEQIQPHFLFNTLNLVSSVMHEDVERADRILAELADLLRQSMSAARAAEHSLAQEMRWVEPFLSIMRQRFGERLRTRIDVSESAARCSVPTLLLMAPVENAVKHGVARSAAGVDVEVAADVVDGVLRIDVVDSGDAPVEPRDGGTGLANARARLATLYGDAAGVTLERADGRTRVRVTLPARSREAA
jgi:two-component system, LytTR family, sensor kinase